MPLGQRAVAYFGTVSYAYGNISHKANATCPSGLMSLWRLVNSFCAITFNSCLVTYYANGTCHIPLHKDNEPSLDSNPTICSVSVGATRTFTLRECSSGRYVSLPLHSGSLLVMRGAVQRFWQHGVPVEVCNKPRYNITFRHVTPG